MKGQTSIEILFLTLVFLTIIIILLPTLTFLQESSHNLTNRLKYLVAKRILEEKIEEVCYLGDGNSRIVYLPTVFNGTLHSDCPLDKPDLIPKRVMIRNINGTVKIEPTG